MRRLKPTEHQEQTAVIQWWAHACKGYGIAEFALFAIPNASKQKATGRFWRKAEGLRAGVPDLFLASGGGDALARGLFIEMKVGSNKPSTDQTEMMATLRRHGYTVVLCYSADRAITVIKEYLR